jgi:hypothetical protein
VITEELPGLNCKYLWERKSLALTVRSFIISLRLDVSAGEAFDAVICSVTAGDVDVGACNAFDAVVCCVAAEYQAVLARIAADTVVCCRAARYCNIRPCYTALAVIDVVTTRCVYIFSGGTLDAVV